MIIKEIWFPLFIIINMCYSQEYLTNSEEVQVPSNLNEILEHLLTKPSSDIKVGHNISYLPQIFQGTIILNINYPESKPAVNIYNSPNQNNNLCNCNKNMDTKHTECKCKEKQNFSNFADDGNTETNKDFKNDASSGQEYVLQTDKANLEGTIKETLEKTSNHNISSVFRNNEATNVTGRILQNKINLPLDRANFTVDTDTSTKTNNIIKMKTTPIPNNNKSANNTLINNSSEFLVADEVASTLLSMDLKNVITDQKLNLTDKMKVTKKIDRLRNLTKSNSTISYLNLQYKKKEFTETNVSSGINLKLSQNNSSNTNVQTTKAIIQESINNFQQFIPPLLNNSFVQNMSDVNSGFNVLCPFPTKCVYLKYCTVDGKISNIPVTLNLEEEQLRNLLPDCADKFTGRTGKCCMDPI